MAAQQSPPTVREDSHPIFLHGFEISHGDKRDSIYGYHIDFTKALEADKGGHYDGGFGRTQITAAVYYKYPGQLTERHELTWQEFCEQGRRKQLQCRLKCEYSSPGSLDAQRQDDFFGLQAVRPTTP